MKIKFWRTIALAFSLLISANAFALDLNEAKQKGWVGEKDNGYLGIVVAEAGVQKLVDDINSQRQTIYKNLATKNNLSVKQVETLAAKKAYAKTLSGNYVWLNGKWVKK